MDSRGNNYLERFELRIWPWWIPCDQASNERRLNPAVKFPSIPYSPLLSSLIPNLMSTPFDVARFLVFTPGQSPIGPWDSLLFSSAYYAMMQRSECEKGPWRFLCIALSSPSHVPQILPSLHHGPGSTMGLWSSRPAPEGAFVARIRRSFCSRPHKTP